MQLIHHSPIIQELLLERFQNGRLEGWQEGEQEGHQKGRYQEILNTIEEMLKFRFSIEATVFEEQLHALDLKALEQLKKAIFTVQTLTEFEKILDAIMAQNHSNKN